MKMSNEEKIMELFSSTAESNNCRYNGPTDKIDYYSIMCKAAATNTLISMMNSNVCMFNCIFNGDPSILILFAIPIILEDNDKGKNKHITERVMDIVDLMERCFTTLDVMNSEMIKEEKFVYLTSIKKISVEE